MSRYAGFKGYDVSAADNLAAYTDAGHVSDWALASWGYKGTVLLCRELILQLSSEPQPAL